MNFVKAGGRTAFSLGKNHRRKGGLRFRVAGKRLPHPADRGGFPRIPREAIEKLLNEKKKGGK